MYRQHYITDRTSQYLPLISQRVSSHLSGHALLIEGSQLTLIINFNQLLAASSGERDVQLKNSLNVTVNLPQVLRNY